LSLTRKAKNLALILPPTMMTPMISPLPPLQKKSQTSASQAMRKSLSVMRRSLFTTNQFTMPNPCITSPSTTIQLTVPNLSTTRSPLTRSQLVSIDVTPETHFSTTVKMEKSQRLRPLPPSPPTPPTQVLHLLLPHLQNLLLTSSRILTSKIWSVLKMMMTTTTAMK